MDVAIKYWLIGLIIMGTSNVLITFLATGAQASNEMGVQTMIHGAPLASFLAAGILAPIIEELTFRKSFFDALKNKWLFILTSGLIFGGLHVISATSWQDFFIHHSIQFFRRCIRSDGIQQKKHIDFDFNAYDS